jgi:hypothetical protein
MLQVRWLHANGRDERTKTYRRRQSALAFARRLHDDGASVRVFVTQTSWTEVNW